MNAKEIVIVVSISQQEKRYRLLYYAQEGCFICKSSARVEEFEEGRLYICL